MMVKYLVRAAFHCSYTRTHPGLNEGRVRENMAHATSDIPFGPQFSPNQVDLPVLLELVQQREGDRRALEGAIRARYFEDRNTSDYNKGKLANNVALGMIAY